MMNIRDFDRTMTRAQWNHVWQILRKTGSAQRDPNYLEDRAALAQHIKDSTVDGMVCRYESGMDCDCVQFAYERNIPAPTVIEFERDRDSAYEWADGPLHIGIGEPVDEPESHSRDLAMEAYEDGHPHVVYA